MNKGVLSYARGLFHPDFVVGFAVPFPPASASSIGHGERSRYHQDHLSLALGKEEGVMPLSKAFPTA